MSYTLETENSYDKYIIRGPNKGLKIFLKLNQKTVFNLLMV